MKNPEPPQHATRDTGHNIASWLDHWRDAQPDAPAIHFEGRATSYRELADRVGRLAGLLRDHGVVSGDRVAILLGNHPSYLEMLFACARVGAIALPINTRLTGFEIQFILADADPRMVFTASSFEPSLRQAHEDERLDAMQSLLLDEDGFEARLAATAPLREVHASSPDDAVILMYTSGTTGHPKGALLPHRKAYWNSVNAQLAFATTARDRVLVAAPLFHSLSLQILSLPALFSGACIVLHTRFDGEAALRAIESEGIHYMGGVPTYFERMREGIAAQRFDLSSLRFLFSAGAALNSEIVREFAAGGLVLKQGYGQTETSMLCCLDASDSLRKAGSVGQPVRHVELRVVRRDSLAGLATTWIDTEPEEVGEIVARGGITMLGYWRRPEETAETLREGWVLTGDLACRDAEGFVSLVGRSREMYISGGENVYPAEVEAAYALHEGIAEIAVVARSDPQWTEVGAAYVVFREGYHLDAQALSEWGRERLAGYKVPRSFNAVNELPRTASGKVQKHRL